jgi:CO/xanthine dehydrogenase Mo-binding subunit
MKDYQYIGKPVVKVDGKDKLTGAAQFTDDIDFGPDLLYAEIVESVHAHAIITGIDTEEAMQVPEVLAVVTGRDFPFKFGLYMKDRYIFAQDRVRFFGEQIAAVVARTPKAARKGAELVRVHYKPLPKVTSQLDALRDDSELLHPELENYPHVPWFFPKAGSNIAHQRKIRKGDIEKAFSESDFVLEDEYFVPRYSHCAIEPHACVAKYDFSGRLTVWASSQSPHTQRHLFAEALAHMGITHNDVRVIAPYVGGGFGSKAGVTMEIMAAAIATKIPGHPVKIMWTREREFFNTYQRLGVVTRLKMGVSNDGRIKALKHDLFWDAGAYVEYGANVVNAVGLSAIGPYKIDNVAIDSYCIYTNLPPGGPYRGFGYSEFLFGLEIHMDRIAEHLGIDPVELRKINGIKEGDTLAYGAHMNASGLHQAIEKVAESIEWGEKEVSDNPKKLIGKGFSLFWKAPAMPPNASSCCFLKLNEDASANLMISGMDIGQGLLTVMAQIAAEILTINPSKIRVETPDTDRNPYEWQTVASHVTWGCGNAVKKAAIDAREQIFDMVVRARGIAKDSLYLENETVKSTADKEFSLPLKSFMITGIPMDDGSFRGGPVLGRGMFMPEFTTAKADPETSQGGHPNVHYTVGAAAIKLEIDSQTGKVKILKVVEAIDAGKVLNPSLAEGQIIGGVLQGISTVLYEDMRFDHRGKMLNPNFTDYKIPTALDVPDEVIPIFVEVEQPDGPFGARGIGEHPMIPVAPMIANAIFDATGIRIKTLPITAEKIFLAMHNQKNNDETSA